MNVACYTLFGEIRIVPVGSVVFRPATYGLLIQDGHHLAVPADRDPAFGAIDF